MHPDTHTPNPLPFATARGWELGEHSPTPAHVVAKSARLARAWQIGLVIGLVMIGPTTAASVLFALTAH